MQSLTQKEVFMHALLVNRTAGEMEKSCVSVCVGVCGCVGGWVGGWVCLYIYIYIHISYVMLTTNACMYIHYYAIN